MRSQEWAQRREGAVAEILCARFGPLLGQTLWSRGLDTIEAANAFLYPRLDGLASPYRLNDLEGASQRIAEAIVEGEQIAVYADYDMDGISGLALLVSFFEACGARAVIAYQPDRLSEGYGVHPEAIRGLADRGAQVVVTVDTGIGAHEGAAEARRLGMDFIVTDHHQQIGEKPPAAFVINPNARGDTSGLTYLSGAGVAFYLAMGVRAKLREAQHFTPERPQPDLRDWLDLFTLGTVADIVDLRDDNRTLVRTGLRQLLVTQRPGLRALLARTLLPASQISARDVSFSIVPKLNAASRLGKAHLSTELLLTRDPERAAALVDEIMALNDERQQIQSAVYDEALLQAQEQIASHDPPVLVVRGSWHEGVLGVVAAKLVEKLGRPSIVLTELTEATAGGPASTTWLRGSMRTLSHFSCVRALDSCGDLLKRYGGHRMAAGLQLAAEHVESFEKRMVDGAKSFLESFTGHEALRHDGALPAQFRLEHVEALETMAPWGSGNAEPLFLLSGVDLSRATTLKEKHIKCKIGDGLDLIGFNKASDLKSLREAGHQDFDVLVTPEVNRFRNRKEVQLRLQYVRGSTSAHSRSGS